jgi:serine/threonine protein kinase
MKHVFRYRTGEIVPGTGLKVIRPLGSGGMGAVYEVEETSVGAPFVMKVVHPHLLLPGSNAAARMNQEARTQARLNQKNVVRVYRAGVTAESPPLPYYVMDRLSGYSVRQVLRWYRQRGAFVPLSWVFWIGGSVLQALEHAHQHGVVHRDVKPDNVFLHHVEQQKPVVKLLDFGIVAAISDLSDKTRLTAGGFAGTFTHAAPEQLQGARPAPTMDIYALGVVMFEMLTGRHPFEDRKDPEHMIRAQLTEPAPRISRAGVHPKLAALVAEMLEKDPQKRPKTAQDTLSRLSRIKTEWMQEGVESLTGNSRDFEFDVDLGERWPTNMDVGGEIATDLTGQGLANSREPTDMLDDEEAARVPPLELPSAGTANTRTRSTWWTTFDGTRTKIRFDHVLLSAAGFAAVTAVVTWALLQHAATHAGSDSPGGAPIASITLPLQSIEGAAVNESREVEAPSLGIASPTFPAPSGIGLPSGAVSMGSRPAFPPPTKAEPAVPLRPLTRHGPSLAKASPVRQSASAGPALSTKLPARVADDPMRP